MNNISSSADQPLTAPGQTEKQTSRITRFFNRHGATNDQPAKDVFVAPIQSPSQPKPRRASDIAADPKTAVPPQRPATMREPRVVNLRNSRPVSLTGNGNKPKEPGGPSTGKDKDKADKEAKEREAKEKVAKEKAAKEAKEQEAKEKAAKEQEAKEKEAKEKAAKDAKEKEAKEAKEKAVKEAKEKEAKEAKEREAKEKAAKEAKEAKEKAAKEQEARDKAAKDAKEKEAKEAKEKAVKEAKEKEEAKEREAKEKAAKEAREKEAKEKAVKDAKEKEAKDAKDNKRDSKDPETNKPPNNTKENKDTKDNKESKDNKRDSKDPEPSKPQTNKDGKEGKELELKEKPLKESKDAKDVKDGKDTKDKIRDSIKDGANSSKDIRDSRKFPPDKSSKKVILVPVRPPKLKAQIEKDRVLGRMYWEPETKIGADLVVTKLYSRRSYQDLKGFGGSGNSAHSHIIHPIKDGDKSGPDSHELLMKDVKHYRIRAKQNATWRERVIELVRGTLFHLYRSVRTGSLRSNVASPEERVYLITQHVEISTVMMNLLAWRRSALFCIVLLSFIQIITAAVFLTSSVESYHLVRQLAFYNTSVFRINLFNETEVNYVSDRVLEHFNLPDPSTFSKTSNQGLEPFSEYAVRALQVGLQRMLIDTDIVSLVLEGVELLITCTISSLAFVGLLYWSSYDVSRRSVMFGWLFAVFGPFIISMLPVQYFVKWGAADQVIQDFKFEFTAAFGLTNATNFEQTTKFISESFVGAKFAINAFRLLVPAALSIAPALIRGAMKAKSVIPQANLPGTFILLVPWLYCPLAWALFNVLLQMMARVLTPFVFVGLLALALQPMAYFIVGSRMEVTSALNDEKVDQTLRIIQKFSNIGSIIGGVLLFVYAFQIPKSELIAAALELLNIPSIVRTIAVTLVQWLYTAVAGVDFMVWQLARDRKHETTMMTSSNKMKAIFSDGDRTKTIEELRLHRDFRLDEFVKFSGLGSVETDS